MLFPKYISCWFHHIFSVKIIDQIIKILWSFRMELSGRVFAYYHCFCTLPLYYGHTEVIETMKTNKISKYYLFIKLNNLTSINSSSVLILYVCIVCIGYLCVYTHHTHIVEPILFFVNTQDNIDIICILIWNISIRLIALHN